MRFASTSRVKTNPTVALVGRATPHSEAGMDWKPGIDTDTKQIQARILTAN